MNKLSAYRDVKNFDVPEMMTAVTLCGVGFENLACSQVPVPEPGAKQLLCRVDAAGICTSLLKLIAQGSKHATVNGWDMEKYPVILGDEGAVTVVKVGDDLKGQYEPGQRFGIQPSVDVAPINHRERYANNAEGMVKCAVGYTLDGNLAQYIVITEEVLEGKCLLELPDEDMAYFSVSMGEPISCIYSAQERQFHIQKAGPFARRQAKLGLLEGGTAVVIGAGAMGRMHTEMAMRFKPANLILSDVVESRLEEAVKTLGPKASQLGIKFLTVHADKLPETVREVSGGRGADDIILAVGIRAVQQSALELLGKGGVANLFGGLPRGDHMLEINAIGVHYDEIKVVGSSGGDPSDLKATLDAIANKDIDPGNYVFGIGGLEHVSEVLKMIKENKVDGKVIVYPHANIDQLTAVEHWDKEKEESFLNENLR